MLLLLYFIPLLAFIKLVNEAEGELDAAVFFGAVLWPLIVLVYVLLTEEQLDKFLGKE